jgi:hypothetical protein
MTTTTANGEQFLELCKAVVEAAREGEDTYRQACPTCTNVPEIWCAALRWRPWKSADPNR